MFIVIIRRAMDGEPERRETPDPVPFVLIDQYTDKKHGEVFRVAFDAMTQNTYKCRTHRFVACARLDQFAQGVNEIRRQAEQ